VAPPSKDDKRCNFLRLQRFFLSLPLLSSKAALFKKKQSHPHKKIKHHLIFYTQILYTKEAKK